MCLIGFVASSGLAATSMVLQMLSSGDHIVSVNDVYGGKVLPYSNVLPVSSATHSLKPLVNFLHSICMYVFDKHISLAQAYVQQNLPQPCIYL